MTKPIYGYFGKQLRIFLNTGEAKIENIDAKILKKYIGGTGYGVKILYDELKAGINPLSPDNKIIFATSPLTMNNIPGGGSVMLCFKSPLTNIWGESRCGGDFGPNIRKSGFDALIIEGKSTQPVYIVIDNGNVTFKPAKKMAGMLVSEKIDRVRTELKDPKIPVITIGPAGENMVRFATAMMGDRAAGRCGVGAVMGSKNLFAIAVKGSNQPVVAHPDKLKVAVKEASNILKNNETASGLREHGTVGDLGANDAAGDWPTKNWQSNSWGKGQDLYDNFFNNYLVGNRACYKGCPIACGRVAKVNSGKFQTPKHKGCEYESISAFTAFILNENMEAAIHATYLCNEYGIDTISAGALIAFAMECYENEIITKEDVSGLDLTWGNPDILSQMVKMISLKQGIGNILCEGVKIASEKIGKGSELYAIHGKGLEGPAHDPRSGKILAIAYATANRGMCHIHPVEGHVFDAGKFDWGMKESGLPDPNTIDKWEEVGKGHITKVLQDGLIVPDILNICKFFMYAGLTLDNIANMFSALTGWDIDASYLMKVGERVINLQRMFNVREGISRADDSFPDRVRSRPAFGLYAEEKKCEIIEFDRMIDEYYKARNWDNSSGKPLAEKLKELDLTND